MMRKMTERMEGLEKDRVEGAMEGAMEELAEEWVEGLAVGGGSGEGVGGGSGGRMAKETGGKTVIIKGMIKNGMQLEAVSTAFKTKRGTSTSYSRKLGQTSLALLISVDRHFLFPSLSLMRLTRGTFC